MIGQERNTKRVKHVKNIVILSLSVFMLFKIVGAFKDTSKALDDVLPSSFVISSEDSSLIAPHYRKGLKVIEVKRNKTREDLVELAIDQHYIITIEKLPVQYDVSLTKAIQTKEENTERTTGVTYSVWPFTNYTYQQQSGNRQLASNIYVLLSGQAIQRQRFTDSVVSFSLKAETISLKYAPNTPTDIFIAGKEKFLRRQPVPMNVMFLKKNGAIYFIVLTEKDGKELPKSNVINEIFN